jgi:hypothetical protein
MEWVNVPDPHTRQGDEAIARLIRRYPALFPSSDPKLIYEHWGTVLGIQKHLRKAWDTSDARRRDWYIFKVRDTYRFHVLEMPIHRKLPGGEIPTEPELEALNEPPPLTLLEQAMVYFQRNADRARHCLNKDCPAPYFFAPRKKKGQRYCSEKCAAQGLKDQKKQWWRDNRGKGGK